MLHIVAGVQGVDDVQGVDGVARVAFNFDWMPEGVWQFIPMFIYDHRI